MNGPLRSKQGCWTCRLRKKKCDEIRPDCSICESLSITCYGYGSKPEWMDGGERERGVAKSIKEIVKRTSRRKGTTNLEQRMTSIRIAPKTATSTENTSLSGDATLLVNVEAPQESPIDMVEEPATSHLPEKGDQHVKETILPTTPEEYVFLMHFLDHVFPLQYPTYKPDIFEGGRGWILSLILRSKPLYYAALALSAYHRRNTMPTAMSKQWQVNALVQQEKYLEACLKQVKGSTNNSCPANGLGIATAVLQLFFYELFTGNGSSWQLHLLAAIRMYQKSYERNLTNFGITETSRKILVEELPLSEYDELVTGEVVTFRFLSTTLTWLGITSSITSGEASPLLAFHQIVLAPNSQTRLENIMGCQNWVMFHIGRVSALYDKKTKALREGHAHPPASLAINAGEIMKDIQCGIILKDLRVNGGGSATACKTKSNPSKLITLMFAYMAIIYLHLVLHDFENLENIEAPIFEATNMLQSCVPEHLLPLLVAPLYIIGSVAKEGDEEFFRNAFSSQPLMVTLLKHRGRIMPVLEEIWRRRRTAVGVEWKDCLGLTHDILLI